MKDSKYCKFHGGRVRKARGEVRIDRLPKFYRNVLSKTLKEFVNDSLGAAPEEQLNLFEELAVFRGLACDVIKLHSKAEEGGNFETKAKAAELMKQALKEVVSVCESAARVSAIGKDKISVHDIQYMVNQIVRVAYATLSEEDARRFERSMKRDVKLPIRDESGTVLTPDMDVSEMDATIPNE